MGDLNDDPTSASVKNVLKAKFDKNAVRKGDLYNPWYDFYRKGIGTLAWNDSWNLFDQIIVSSAFLDKEQSGYFMHQPIVYNKEYLTQKSGRFKGYPYRTFAGGQYLGGYSDHFPVFIYFVKEVN